MVINFGEINKYILFGGGELLYQVVKFLKKENFCIFVVTSERHSNELVATSKRTIPLIEFLKDERIDYIISKDVSQESHALNRITENTLGMSFGAAWIFRKQFIELFNGRLLNCHGARLPQNRGGGGYSWRILTGERAGVSLIHQIDIGVDTGNILMSKEYMYPNTCKIPIDYQRYSIIKYQELFRVFFAFIKDCKSFELTIQQERFSSYWPRLATDIHGYIDWSWALKKIEKFVCAFDDPYNGASTFLNGKKVKLKKCHSSFNEGVFHPFQNGLVYRIYENIIFVSVEEGTLIINSVLDEKNIDIKDSICIGDRFYTPIEHLEKAKQYRAVYSPVGLG
jgi:methionyl-tRNA formyltransferase